MPLARLPADWRGVVDAIRRGEDTNGLPPPAESRIKNVEEVRRQYAWVMIDAGLPVEIIVPGLRLMEQQRTETAERRRKKKKAEYSDHGAGPRHGGIP